MELTIRPKNRYAGKRERDVQVVSQETWQNMINNGMASRFVIVSQEVPALDDKMERIKQVTEEIQAHSRPDFQNLLSDYRKAKKTDKEKALAILKEAEKMHPENSYVNKELKLYNND